MHRFRQLLVWRKAHELSLRVHRMVSRPEWRDHPGFAERLREAAFAIAHQVAAGHGCHAPTQFARALRIASGRALQLDCQLLLARDLVMLEPGDHTRLEARVAEVRRMLDALERRVRGRGTDQGSGQMEPPAGH